MIPPELMDIDTDDAVEEAIKRMRPFIRATAQHLSEGDIELAQDMEQEAGIALWRVDPTRFDATDDEYLHGVLFKTMQKTRRRERAFYR